MHQTQYSVSGNQFIYSLGPFMFVYHFIYKTCELVFDGSCCSN